MFRYSPVAQPNAYEGIEKLVLLVGGDKGGKIVFTGTPEEIIKHKTSFTGKYLRDFLK